MATSHRALRHIMDDMLGSDQSTTLHSPLKVVRITPPRNNQRDALAVANLLSALQVRAPFSLELSATHERKQILMRADERTMRILIAHLEGAYPQARFEEIGESDDPARIAPHEHVLSAELTLARPEYLPLRTFRDQDFKAADPLVGILGAMSKLEAGERTLTQIVLTSAPSQWAKRWQGSLRAVEAATSVGAPGAPNGWAFAFWLALPITVFWFLIHLLTANWLGLLFTLIVGIPTCVGLWLGKERLTFNANPVLVQQKVAPQAYRAWIRLCAIGPAREPLYDRLQQIVGAYR